jgi:hypothetical protein
VKVEDEDREDVGGRSSSTLNMCEQARLRNRTYNDDGNLLWCLEA